MGEYLFVNDIESIDFKRLDAATMKKNRQFNSWLQGIVRRLDRLKTKAWRSSYLNECDARYIFTFPDFGKVVVTVSYRTCDDECLITVHPEHNNYYAIWLFMYEHRHGVLQVLREAHATSEEVV